MPKICYVPRNFDKIGTRLTTLAEQIINEYSKQGFDLTLRQLYYQFVARDLLPDKWADKTTGSKNNQRSYSNLGSLINNARLAGLIDWYAIVDRTRGLVKNSHWDNPAEIVDQCAQSYQIDKWAEQETRVELWIEKDALAGIVDSVCRSLDIPYFSCRGYTSQSEMWIGAMRLRRQIKNGQGVIVLHLGDHDPSGIDMTRDITDRISLFTAGSHHELVVENGGDQSFDIGEVAHDQLGERLGIPRKYYDRMREETPNLLAVNVNTWLKQQPERRPVRTLDNRVRAFLSDKYRPLDNFLVASAALPILHEQGANIEIISSEMTERRLYLQAITHKHQGEVRKGDVVKAGLVISNSEIGLGAVRVETLLYRLVCLNGMITSEGIRRHHVGKRLGGDEEIALSYYETETIEADNKAFLLKIRDTVKHHLEGIDFNAHLDRMKAAAEQRLMIAKVDDMIEEVTARFSLSKTEGGGILENLIKGGDATLWGLANAVTAMANDTADYDRVIELERIGGRIIDLTPSEFKYIQAA